ncbi:uncharacterized protein L3040_005884 [Drepanopeziza brunnea f. sp. 'multigermtubi']|uniref:Uncharacterized protein n=1 Tax=Marssonina brunnea f. sp. multigermtubi (strain MB_m1) TaxID=1072389 RepID=K1W511_MARBU|nr:uncharacterized protein MBM_09873 [Drepanopeziza brunnea f. sp. 'multigermtubi' MB_m1]EKD12010.1 hypothetical protein MBM_09873 [Drepanopeziza brunnea f. sp. 'multigermtubi' MB_m1]KAJ5040222.1 hypothetical protein L3040_005884 [Drepanopeziza brunnea f. sp. 'multigermtubi']
MWQRPQIQTNDDPFTTPSTPTSTRLKWATNRPPRIPLFRLRHGHAKIVFALSILGLFVMIRRLIPSSTYLLQPIDLRIYSSTSTTATATTTPYAAFQPPEASPYRIPDSTDVFQSYKFRNICDISSLDLHAPFSPLCADRASMLAAMSGGGRIGYDAPYMPRGCDMRWFSTEEVCEILGRFEKVVLVGDSMLRHITGSLNVLVRKDLGYGAVTDWNFSLQERRECFCNEQFDVKACSVQGIYKTADVMANDPASISCPNNINVIMEQIVKYPIPEDEIRRLKEDVTTFGKKPIAVILGHGLWSNLDLQMSVRWLDGVIGAIRDILGSEWTGLFITPNAAGKEKPDDWIVTQGNKALMLFEEAVGMLAKERGLDHLGTWNMSIQSNKYDGVHLDMKGNLVKAMMVLNWLNMIKAE